MKNYYEKALNLRDEYGWDNKDWARHTGIRQSYLEAIANGSAPEDKDVLKELIQSTMYSKFKGMPKMARFSSPVVLAISIHKGGSGKTTCAVGIADDLASRGYNVLLIDSDSQMDATSTLLPGVDTSTKSLFASLAVGSDVRPQIFETNYDRLDIVPSSTRMASAEAMLMSQATSGIKSDYTFRAILEGVRNDNYYDFIIVDMDKTIGSLNRSILTGCTHLLMVAEASLYHLSGFAVMKEQFDVIKDTTNPDLELLGVVFNKVSARKSIVSEMESTFDENLPGFRFKSYIRNDASVEKAQWNNLPLRVYNKRSNAWKDIMAVTDEIIERLSNSSLLIKK